MRFHTKSTGNVPFTAEEEAEADAREAELLIDQAAQAAIDSERDRKYAGVLFDGVMCSAMKEDMWGLSSVKGYVMAGGTANFKFENGNMIVLTPASYAAFEAVWTPFRASFF